MSTRPHFGHRSPDVIPGRTRSHFAGFAAQTGHEFSAKLPQIMQQPRQRGFVRETQRLAKTFGQLRHIAQVRGQQLPVRLIWIRLPVRSHRRMSVIIHPMPEVRVFQNRS